jgi:dihydrofolate reductase
MSKSSTGSDRKIVYSLAVSLDGYINGLNGELDWHVVDAEVMQFIRAQVKELDTFLIGRRLYEVMTYWDTAEDDPSISSDDRDFARRWNEQRKIVFSNTLEHVQGNARLADTTLEGEINRLKSTPGGDIEVGGATLAAQAMQLDLIDEFRLYLNPVVLGGGTRCFPESGPRFSLQRTGFRQFASGVTYLQYARLDPDSSE